jgi:molybdopterin converting factor small subunit
MPNTLLIPAPLRLYTGGHEMLTLSGKTVGEALQNLTTQFPLLRTHLFDERGEIRSFINVYLNQEDIRYLNRQQTRVEEGDQIRIVPSVAGG